MGPVRSIRYTKIFDLPIRMNSQIIMIGKDNRSSIVDKFLMSQPCNSKKPMINDDFNDMYP